jgi:hypothetical protein
MTSLRNAGDLRVAQCLTALFALCVAGSVAPAAAAQAKTLRCDDSIKTAFKPDSVTTVIAVKSFQKGEPLILSGTPTERTPIAVNNLCLVKLNVGPGNPGPANAPSTSPGIGIEVWLPTPANWIGRVHAIGGNGWSGGNAGSPTRIANSMNAAGIAATEGAVTSTCDSGHSGVNPSYPDIATTNAAFAMDPDGTLSKAQWRDHSIRSVHEQAVKTKALATSYYGSAPKHSYFDGGSQGGRQGYKLAQEYPADYDGIAAIYPAINWTRWSMGDLYARIVFQRDLAGVVLTEAQQDLVSNAAIQACDVVGGQHLGYVMDPAACRYDPTRDPSVLCTTDGGTNTTADCVTKVQAGAVNKIWYGITADGSVPSPAVDNGWDKEPAGARRWYGPPRGASLYNAGLRRIFGGAGTGPRRTAETDRGAGGDMVALALQNPTMAGPEFKNASGDGQGLWLTLSYAQFANAFDRAVALQPLFNDVDAVNPDLSAFKARGGKLLTWHGLDDAVVHTQGTIQYYRRVIDKMGGLANVQSFYRLYLVPGIGHSSANGTANPDANPPSVGAMTFYDLMVNWVEKGIAPERVEVESPAGTPGRIGQPICPYPQKASYQAGDPRVTTSYVCASPAADQRSAH